MKRLWLILMPSLLLIVRTWIITVLLLPEEANGIDSSYLSVSVSDESLRQIPSCIPGLSWIELENTVSETLDSFDRRDLRRTLSCPEKLALCCILTQSLGTTISNR